MFLVPATPAQARQIAKIYRAAFPQSIRRFFRQKEGEVLLDLLELSFILVFYWGGKGILAKNKKGQICGYCLYSSEKGGAKNLEKLLKTGLALLTKIRICKIGLLALNQVMKLFKTRKSGAEPNRGACIISIAVAPEFQGRGIGSLLLKEALEKLSAEWVILKVRSQNYPARNLYKQTGFRSYGCTEDLSGKWIMLKRPPL